ncbi:uncharacterized protein MELLADRAFT_70042 [Melampsora larici-populina 98AG31]|uniref:Helitron helicase-like domain-containing protein n=1 Tax=Melampsora larici-populina (strain 98AG31 / pathotype 3-4-7) TaxID=747676 RepID=F4SDA5_MELLP|nr:uncharacterized protein MELLADRAFT_70042 [Melampsora larici-populina 98AG31]EGF97377.1 hypothetical protein MELLADRAFT_70042 [Melampsora larici-populina 98AG31]
MPHDLGPLDDPCQRCGALHWIAERPSSAKVTGPYEYNMCCSGGKIKPPVDFLGDHVVPEFVRTLMTSNDEGSAKYRDNIQSYNNALSFTSLGAHIDKSVNGQRGMRVFRINGALVHNIDGLQPREGHEAGHAQIYVIGGGDRAEAQHRRNVANNQELDLDILQQFQDYFYKINPFAHEVAMIVEGEGLVGDNARDIILYKKQGAFERVSDLHTSYLALRYVVFFPKGQQGYDEHYRMPDTNGELGSLRVTFLPLK